MDFSNWTPEQIITLAGIIFGFMSTSLLAVGGWVVVSKLNKANTAKAKAETIVIYQNMLQESAERERELVERVNSLEKDLTKVHEMLADKVKENSSLQRQLAELKVQSDEQAQQITTLTEELQTLRNKRK